MIGKISKYIKTDPKIHSGMPVIAGTRVTVAEIIDYLETEKNVEDVIKTLKKAGVLVTRKEVYAALDFAKYRTSDETKTSKTS